MAYNVNYSDVNTKTPIRVEDNTSNTDTSLVLPGRNVTGYGRIIAENFLHLLENFASPSEPVNAVEGQLWYDSSTGTLMINDGTGLSGWRAASSIQKSPNAPSVGADKVGEVWVDTVKQQLYVWSGAAWVLVGPTFSSEGGLRTGPIIETINDSDNTPRRIVKFLVEDIPIAIISKDSFTPKVTISGFNYIRSGVNVTQPDDTSLANNFDGGLSPVIYGIASSAEGLNDAGITVPAAKFLRSDKPNTTEYGISIRNNSGLTLGVDGTFKLSNSNTSSKIYNATAGSSIDFDVNRNNEQYTTLRILGDKVGINVASPQQELDIDGNVAVTGSIIVTNNEISTNLENGSIRTAGGAAISRNLIVGTELQVRGDSYVKNIFPADTEVQNIGSASKKFNNIFVKTVKSDYLEGVLVGDVSGNARTATNLRQVSTFQLLGDVTSNVVSFDGAVGGATKQFTTSLTSEIISNKEEPFPNLSTEDDFVLVFRSGLGLVKESRDVFVSDLAVPIGAIMPYAGINVPYGYLLCDGAEVEKAKYSKLFDIIGNVYGATVLGVNTFKLPDLRGRFALGKDNMDNGETVPTTTGRPVDSGGGAAGRGPGAEGSTLGASAGAVSTQLAVGNLPDHEHTLTPPNSDRQFNLIRVDTAVVAGAAPGPGLGPTAPGQAQYLNTSGGVKTTVSLGQPLSTLNPFLTINYIIHSGPPAF